MAGYLWLYVVWLWLNAIRGLWKSAENGKFGYRGAPPVADRIEVRGAPIMSLRRAVVLPYLVIDGRHRSAPHGVTVVIVCDRVQHRAVLAGRGWIDRGWIVWCVDGERYHGSDREHPDQ